MQNQIKIKNESKEKEIKIVEQKYKKSHHKEKMIKQLKTCQQIFIENDFESHKYFFY